MAIKNYQIRCKCGFTAHWLRFLPRLKYDKIPPYHTSTVDFYCPVCKEKSDRVERGSRVKHPLRDEIFLIVLPVVQIVSKL